MDQDLVLLVEDDLGIRALLADVLSEQGYMVLQACDGQEAIDIIDQSQPIFDRLRLVLLDMMLPRVDGMFVLKRLTQRGCEAPIIAMSGSTAHLAAAERAGAVATLAKPFELIDLIEAVARHCG